MIETSTPRNDLVHVADPHIEQAAETIQEAAVDSIEGKEAGMAAM
jgi:hypothetical protein